MLSLFAAVVLSLHQVATAHDNGGVLADGNAWQVYKMSVTIKNELPDVLGVHCRSKTDDLGLHYLQPRNGVYYFEFHSYFGATLFTCTFWHDEFHSRASYTTFWNSFPVWTDSGFVGNKKRPCEQCVWTARTDALLRCENGAAPIPVYQWRTDTPPCGDAAGCRVH